MRRIVLLASVMLLTLTAFAGSALADEIDFDLRGGYYADDAEGPFIGAGVLTGFGSTGQWFFNPNVEFAFGDNVDVITGNADFHYDLPTSSSLAFWVGGGPAVVHYDPDFGRGSETDFGVNAFFGFGAREGSLRPYFQIKALVSDESELVIGGGIRF